MRNALILSLLLLLGFNYSSAQIPVGLKYDCNGYAFNGYYDPLVYAPDEKLTKVHNSDSFEVGYYYDKQGNKIEGQILFSKKKIFFKQQKIEFPDLIRPTDINSFVIGVDSFFVVSNFYYKDKLRTKPEYVQYITEFNGLTFAKHYTFTFDFEQRLGEPPIVETYLVKSKYGSTWENFPDNSKFKENAQKYFGDFPYIIRNINAGKYTHADMLSIIKMAEYYEKYQNSEPIYYDKYWQEVNDNRKSTYYAKIINSQDTIWTFEYYDDSTKLFSANYSSLYPHIKNGEFISFYPNGVIRQSITFENNKPKDFKTYDELGVGNGHYQYIDKMDEKTYKITTSTKYLPVIDTLSSEMPHLVASKDSYSNTTYFRKYKGNELVSSYRMQDNDTVFQVIDKDYKFKIYSLQMKFDSFMRDKHYDVALSENAQGTILISIVIDKKGYPVSCTMLNKIHPEIDGLVKNFIWRTIFPGSVVLHAFKPYKENKKKQFCEFVIPIEFSTNRFYRKPAKYNYDSYWIMHNQQMMYLNNHY